jgi:hypothetical protein
MLIDRYQKLVHVNSGAGEVLSIYLELPKEWRELGETTISTAWLTVKSDLNMLDSEAEVFVTVDNSDTTKGLLSQWGWGAKLRVELPATVVLIPGFYYNLGVKYKTATGRTRYGFLGNLVSTRGTVNAS